MQVISECMSDSERAVEQPAQEAKAAVRLRTPERRQVALVVQCPDDLVGPTHPVRRVMVVVEKLDLARFCEPIQAREGVAGRDATDPELLVALWLYGCIRGIGSARELARRCEESGPFRWLCGGVGVNHRMLSDFRTDHGPALEQLFTQVIASLVDQELVSVSRVSQDGVRVRVRAGAASRGAGKAVGRSGEEEQGRAASGPREAAAFGTSVGATAGAAAAPAGTS